MAGTPREPRRPTNKTDGQVQSKAMEYGQSHGKGITTAPRTGGEIMDGTNPEGIEKIQITRPLERNQGKHELSKTLETWSRENRGNETKIAPLEKSAYRLNSCDLFRKKTPGSTVRTDRDIATPTQQGMGSFTTKRSIKTRTLCEQAGHG